MSVESNESTEILELTEQMLELALSGQWERLFSVEAMRAKKITQMQFSENDRAMIEHILGMDEKVCDLAKQERLDLLCKLKKLSKGKSAINAYAS